MDADEMWCKGGGVFGGHGTRERWSRRVIKVVADICERIAKVKT